MMHKQSPSGYTNQITLWNSVFSVVQPLLLLSLFLTACSSEPDRRFTLLPVSHTGIDFSNDLENTPEFNILNYLYFYNGGGVAAGDLNNNGLPDLFFTGNDVPDRLYLNRGDFVFEDITEAAGIAHEPWGWSTGVTMADVTGDGYLDIYVSRVNYLNKRGRNQLYINNGDMTFTEQAAEFGLDFEGYSTQAVFFDYNNNGLLDLFLLNHSFHSDLTYGPADTLRQIPDPKAGDRLFRNDGGRFTDVTEEAGIISSALGYGLGVAVSDINKNGYLDIYVGNDFHEDDYFYINNGDPSGDGQVPTFTESLYAMIGHTSSSSMGNDIADITNNGWPDIVSLDMMPEDHETFMRSGGPDIPLIANTKKEFGFGEKNARNTLQIHRGVDLHGLPLFSEMAFASGVAATEWSWAALLADFDNSGRVDLFVTNGMPRRPNDLDFVTRLQRVRQQYTGEELTGAEFELIQTMPEVVVPNVLFKNEGKFIFRNVSEEWGFSTPVASSGTVYVDLNNNGLLDLVVNNMNERAFIYRNDTPENEAGSYLKVKLDGDGMNTTGIGSKVLLYHGEQIFYREQMPTRGFQSSVDHVLHFGLGEITVADSLLVIWPDRRFQVLTDVETNRQIELSQAHADGEFDYHLFHKAQGNSLLMDVTSLVNLNHTHRENRFDDFHREPLMPYKNSTRGPAIAVADITGNGLDDLFIGGAHGDPGRIFIQEENGEFSLTEQPALDADSGSEDVDALFFDATGNGLPDLYVVSGGNEKNDPSPDLQGRLYINNGGGIFLRSTRAIPGFTVHGSVAATADFNGNGALDLFVGGHTVPWRYGIGPRSFILQNNGEGIFEDVTKTVAPELETIGNVTAAAWIHQPGKNLPDLVVTGEWMPIHYFENRDGRLVKRTDEMGLAGLSGLWQSIRTGDLTGNGHDDIVAGNFGINSRLQASHNSPLRLYVNDFDGNGQTAPLITREVDGKEVPFEQLDELLGQISDITRRVRSYHDYATRQIHELFDPGQLDDALHKEIRELRSLVLLNDGEGNFTPVPLPFEAQLFPVTSLFIDDIDGDGIPDLLLAGNIHGVKPGMGGRQDAGYGLVLKGDGSGQFEPLTFRESGFLVRGEARGIEALTAGSGEKRTIVVRNDEPPLFFQK